MSLRCVEWVRELPAKCCSQRARHAALHLAIVADNNACGFWRHRDLARWLDASQSTARRAIDELVSKHIITRVATHKRSGYQGPNQFRLHVDGAIAANEAGRTQSCPVHPDEQTLLTQVNTPVIHNVSTPLLTQVNTHPVHPDEHPYRIFIRKDLGVHSERPPSEFADRSHAHAILDTSDANNAEFADRSRSQTIGDSVEARFGELNQRFSSAWPREWPRRRNKQRTQWLETIERMSYDAFVHALTQSVARASVPPGPFGFGSYGCEALPDVSAETTPRSTTEPQANKAEGLRQLRETMVALNFRKANDDAQEQQSTGECVSNDVPADARHTERTG